MTSQSPAIDGRHRRSERSRLRIIDAIIELVNAGVLEPTAEQVSAQAGLAMRTVFRHFKDMDSLYREIARRTLVEAQAISATDTPADSWQDGLHNLVDRRARIYEKLMPMRLSGDAVRHRSPFLQEENARLVTLFRNALRKVLPQPLRRDRMRFEALDLLLSFEAWIRLRREQKLSAHSARATLHASVDALLANKH
jgi:AcrR family transcriptional regulator